MRKVLVLALIGWTLAAGASASYAMEKEQPLPPAPDIRSAGTLVTVDRATTAGSAAGIRIQSSHDRN